jgi:hypothetical protein
LPEVRQKTWPGNEIDYFILKAQEKAGLKPGAEAGNETLLRRLSFDLTGMPPAIKQMDLFL